MYMRQSEVFEAVLEVVIGLPFGQTVAYGGVTEEAGNKNWTQTVGRQLGAIYEG